MANKIDITKQDSKDKTGINTLPEYKIRTMKDDLAKAKPAKEVAPPEKLPVAPEKKLPKPPAPPKPKVKKPKPAKAPKIKPTLPKKPRAKKKLKTLIFLIIILLIVLGIGLFFYWQGTKPEEPPTPSEEDEGQAEPQVEPEQLVPSESLISVDETKILSLSTETSLFELMKQEAKASQSIDSFKRIAILKNETDFLSLNELFQELEINAPPYTLTETGPDYTLVLYSQAGGRRLGLIAQVKNSENLKTQLTTWEQTMLEDFENFYPDQTPEEPASETFLDANYQNINIRYVNLPNPDLALNYAIKNNFLIIGTSKDIMYEIVDKL